MSMARILVIDDEPAFADFAKILLESLGHTAVLCLRADEALETALRCRPDLVITDMNMPEADGLTVISQFKARPELAAVPILLASASTDDKHRSRALREGALYSIAKPLQKDMLKTVIDKLVPPAP